MTGLPGFPPYIYYYCKYESFTCTVKDTDEKVYIVEGLECLGVKLDLQKNAHAKGGDDISAADSAVRVYIVDTNEEIIVARKARALLTAQ